MISPSLSRKIKITLSDYAYRRDIENRLLLSQLSLFEVDVLKEIVHCSLKISIEHLADHLDVTIECLLPILDKLSLSKLFKREHMTLLVDKEMRKYYEFQIEKFDEDFEPNLDFLQNLLNKVPINVLPLWYAIPRTSDNIFSSIIENYFLTPKIYRQYLEELQFDDPILADIMRDLYSAPGFKLTANQILTKYGLSRERFEECLLLLEYHFVCCLSYNKINNRWEEVITPFYEWLEYLKFEASTNSRPILDKAKIEQTCQIECGFIKEMEAVLNACQNKKKSIQDIKPLYLKPSDFAHVFVKLTQTELAKKDAGALSITEKGLLWLKKTLNEKTSQLAVDPLNKPLFIKGPSVLWNPRNLRLIEKNLRKLKNYEWIYLDDFLEGFSVPLGEREPIVLKNRGKKWKYALPVYTEEELHFIRTVITERLFELGVVATGKVNSKNCFCITPFGHLFIH